MNGISSFFELVTAITGRIHSRSLGERRALFFATFVIVGSLVFSAWTRHMYRQFGLVFSERVVERVATSAADDRFGAGGAEAAASSGPPPPLATLRENLSVLKKGSMGFVSEILPFFSQGLRPQGETSEAVSENQKEPPLLDVREETLSAGVGVLNGGTPAEELSAGALVGAGAGDAVLQQQKNESGENSIVAAAGTGPGRSGGADAADGVMAATVLSLGGGNNQQADGSLVLFVEVPVSEESVSENEVDQETVLSRMPPSGFYAIFTHNLETIRRGAVDFYEYLTR